MLDLLDENCEKIKYLYLSCFKKIVDYNVIGKWIRVCCVKIKKLVNFEKTPDFENSTFNKKKVLFLPGFHFFQN